MLGELDNIQTHPGSIHSDRFCGRGKAELSVGITMRPSVWSGKEPLQSWEAAHCLWPSAYLEENKSQPSCFLLGPWPLGPCSACCLWIEHWSPSKPEQRIGRAHRAGAILPQDPGNTARVIPGPIKLSLVGQVPQVGGQS